MNFYAGYTIYDDRSLTKTVIVEIPILSHKRRPRGMTAKVKRQVADDTGYYIDQKNKRIFAHPLAIIRLEAALRGQL